MQEAVVACQADAAGAELKDVEGAGEKEGELEGGADGGEGGGRRVVGGEDGGVEGVVLRRRVSLGWDGGERGGVTLRPMTPRQAMEGMAVAMVVWWCVWIGVVVVGEFRMEVVMW